MFPKRTHNTARYIKAYATGHDNKVTVMDDSQALDALSQYKAERARGLVHTQEWQEAMKELQERFDDGELR